MNPIIREKYKFLREENKNYSNSFILVLVDEIRTAYRNNKFLVQVYKEEKGIIRLSINRTEIDDNGNWKDNITWDELQKIKNEIGFINHDAIEIFPKEIDKVNVANMRHLWILNYDLPFIWRAKK